MNNQLSNISTQYRKFSKGQYIEHTQFNEFLDFFEDQDRLSRVLLQGVGIVCGLKPKLMYTGTVLNSVQLSQGVAITTDGDLLTLNNTNKVSEDLYVSDLKTINIENKNYTHFKVYDNFKVKYPAFHDESGNQIELWELGTAQEANSDFQTLNNLSNLNDKYLLLYLEDSEKEVKPCRGVDCDNHGIQQIRNLKVLVTTAQGIKHIIEEDHIQPHPLFIDGILGLVKQERVIVERLILNNGIETQFYTSDLKKLYTDVLEKSNYGKSVFDKINAISQIIGTPTVYYQDFKDTVEEFLTQKMGFQYAYDVVKDLMDTYFEIIKWLPESFTKCLPELSSFPKHIMLGKLVSSAQLDSFRHRFYNSPVLDDEKTTRRVYVLIDRFYQQVQNFKYFNVFDNGSAEIKITPSQKLNPLGKKAVPFYYTVTDEFLKTWNFCKTSNRSFKDNLAYNNDLLSTGIPQNPLNFNIDKNSFYNIEGHQGMDYRKAFGKINQIRNNQQLGFDTIVLSLEELVNNKDMFKEYFNEYVDKHPGLEHKHGVERGGTFVIVYESLENPRVIADFSLPYVCCTPKIEVKLVLPNTVICSKSSRIPFTVFPMNGDVEAAVDTGLNGGVELVDGLYFFNPALVSPELHGQEIIFTVNGKLTNCSIKVIPEPNVNIIVDTVLYPEGGSTATKVNFTVSGKNFTGYEYSWDFWDNGSFVTLSPDAKGNMSYTFYDLNPTKIPTIKVNVGGDGCTQTIAINDWYHGPSTVINEIFFPEGGNCCETINTPPVAVAEASKTKIQLPVDSVTLIGSSSYDPDGMIVSYSWKQISLDPLGSHIIDPNSADTEVKGLVEGTYAFQLTVTDNYGETETDKVVITVSKANAPTPSLIEIENNASGPDRTRVQVFKVGPNVAGGNVFQVGVYNVILTVIATASDTPVTIAVKIASLINETTKEEWNKNGLAPTSAVGFPPKASASEGLLTINLNYENEFFSIALVH